jgi:hypothetical protein
MGWDYVSERRPPTGLLFIPHVRYISMENNGGIMSTEENSFVYQSSLAILHSESSGSKQEEWAKGMGIWPCELFLYTPANDFNTP